MRVKELIEILKRFDPKAEVHLCLSLPGRVIATHENIWIADYGGGPQVNASLDFKQFHVYVGCGIEQFVRQVPETEFLAELDESPTEPEVELGTYESDEDLWRVRDFYIYHHLLNAPLRDPDFDYENWIPPRTISGEYNEHIAAILREKLLKE